MWIRMAMLVGTLAALTLGGAGSVSAAQTYADSISGYEYYPSSTDGRFAGTASGSLPGPWNADVQHTQLCASCTPTASITGGSLSLATTLDFVPTLVTGRFTGGTVLVTDVGAGCTNQTFAVAGILGSVGPWYSGSGSGTFSATLTHYRHSVFGVCITYAASVTGSLALSF